MQNNLWWNVKLLYFQNLLRKAPELEGAIPGLSPYSLSSKVALNTALTKAVLTGDLAAAGFEPVEARPWKPGIVVG
jgi:hypothetical protein